MGFQEMTYKYFFGSDKRSIPYLNTLIENYDSIKVVTTEPRNTGRGRKILNNPVEDYCRRNNVECSYFSNSKYYDDMDFGICVSFGSIFSNDFLNKHPSIFNIHLSILPNLVGPSPVETTILNGDTLFGYTIFKIINEVDKGPVLFTNQIDIVNNYSSNVYEELSKDFKINFESIDFNSSLKEQVGDVTRSYKFTKNDYLITKEDTLINAKNKIKAFDVLGPAFIKYDSKIIKIHKYTEDNSNFTYELKDGLLYLDEITPEGKKRMKANDYMRGLQ